MYVNFNILNQLGSPSLNSNTFANRPAAGQTGRLFISTDTFEIYRDNGTGWDLIGTGTGGGITGSGTANQVTYWTGTSAVGGESAFTYNPTTNELRVDGNISAQTNASPWWSGSNVLQIYNGAFGSAGNSAFATGNAYFDGSNWKYIANDTATRYEQNGAQHQFNRAVSGTAGNSISWLTSMILDSSGNMGVSTSPGAWNTNYRAVEIAIGSSFYSNTAASDSGLARNAYFDSIGWKYNLTGSASWYQQSDNNHYWFVAPSGTAGNPITFTQVMRVFTTANLVIGSNTDNGFRLQVNGDSQINGVRIGRGNSAVSSNTVLGTSAGNAVTTGTQNTFIGNESGLQNTTGSANIFIGDQSGRANNGSSNVFVGANSGQLNVSGANNTFIGVNCGTNSTSSNNVYFGKDCAQTATTGTENSFFGYRSGQYITTGSNNCIFGFQAGRVTNSGSNLSIANNSILIGHDARVNSGSETNQIVIGYQGRGLGSNTTAIGNSATSFGRWWGNLLLGTSTNDTTKALRVNGAVRIDGQTAIAAGGSAGLHLIVNCDGTDYKIALLNV